jgi:hypothetical protein
MAHTTSTWRMYLYMLVVFMSCLCMGTDGVLTVLPKLVSDIDNEAMNLWLVLRDKFEPVLELQCLISKVLFGPDVVVDSEGHSYELSMLQGWEHQSPQHMLTSPLTRAIILPTVYRNLELVMLLATIESNMLLVPSVSISPILLEVVCVELDVCLPQWVTRWTQSYPYVCSCGHSFDLETTTKIEHDTRTECYPNHTVRHLAERALRVLFPHMNVPTISQNDRDALTTRTEKRRNELSSIPIPIPIPIT